MWIARRVLKLRQGNSITDLSIYLFAPEKDGTAWKCRYEIDWPQGKRESAATGIDSMQAVVLAFQKIGTDLYMSDSHRNGELSWDTPGSGYGFPLPANGRELLIGDDRKFF